LRKGKPFLVTIYPFGVHTTPARPTTARPARSDYGIAVKMTKLDAMMP
jgi:hypothetical protein